MKEILSKMLREDILMIRKILKWISIVLGSLIGLLVLAFVVLYIIGSAKWNKLHGKYEVPVETIPIPTDQASIARGEHIATIRMCGYCHTETLSGESDAVPGLVTLTFPNLTAGAGGVVGTNTQRRKECLLIEKPPCSHIVDSQPLVRLVTNRTQFALGGAP
jgi:hypothetical protein